MSTVASRAVQWKIWKAEQLVLGTCCLHYTHTWGQASSGLGPGSECLLHINCALEEYFSIILIQKSALGLTLSAPR